MTSTIPTLDLLQFTQGAAAARQAFIQELGKAYEDVGFVAIRNHGLDEALRERLYAAVQAFFALPADVKLQYDGTKFNGQRGYTPAGREHAKGRNVGDLKEFFQVGQTVEDGDPIAQTMEPNVFPTEIADFAPAVRQGYRTLETAGRQMLRAIALYLHLPEDYFEAHVHNGNSILRAIHYYPIEDPDSVPADAVRAAEHEDINLITLLMGASAEGLELLRRDGQWLPVTVVPDCVVVNVGDMLQRLTNNVLRSTTHRVVNPPREKMGTSRYSIPFFLHPRANMSLACLPQCITADRPKAYPDATAGEYLMERLREIGLA